MFKLVVMFLTCEFENFGERENHTAIDEILARVDDTDTTVYTLYLEYK